MMDLTKIVIKQGEKVPYENIEEMSQHAQMLLNQKEFEAYVEDRYEPCTHTSWQKHDKQPYCKKCGVLYNADVLKGDTE